MSIRIHPQLVAKNRSEGERRYAAALLVTILVATFMVLGGCDRIGSRNPPAAPSARDEAEVSTPSPARPSVAPAPKLASLASGLVNQENPQPAGPMIARSVSLSIEVADVAAARTALDALVARHGAYAAQLTVETPPDAPHRINASLRIPVPALAAAMADLKALGRVLNESQSAEEVSQQHADMAQRLSTARDAEERYESILKLRTTDISDVLQVQEKIAEVRGEIEAMEAEQRTLEHRVEFATVDLTVSTADAGGYQRGGSAWTQMRHALVEGWRNAIDTVLGIILFAERYGLALLIWLAILAVPVTLWRRRRRILRAKRTA